MSKLEPLYETPRVLAHRGTSEAFTENGLLAFQYVIDHGVRGFETDFRLTADGVVVVMHDANIHRTTTGEGIVEAMTLAELKKVKLKNSDETIPTAEELFSLFDGLHDFVIELEMKARYGEYYSEERMDLYLNQLYDLAQKHLSKGFVLFTCFDHAVLKRLKELHPDAKTGLIYGGLDEQAIADALALGCCAIAPTLRDSPRALVQKAIAAGLKVNLWHSETLELWQQARDWGAVNSTNNHPVAVLQAIRENR